MTIEFTEVNTKYPSCSPHSKRPYCCSNDQFFKKFNSKNKTKTQKKKEKKIKRFK